MTLRDRPHLRVKRPARVETYRPHPPRIDKKPIDVKDRPGQGAHLTAALQQAQGLASQRRQAANVDIPGAHRSIYIEFASRPGVALEVDGLGDPTRGIEVANVRRRADVEYATVVVPEGQVGYFLKRFAAYAKPTAKRFRERRYEGLLDPVRDLLLATLRALWTDDPDRFPDDDEVVWWEVWLRRTDGHELARVGSLTGHFGMDLHPHRLQFDERIIVLLKGCARDLATSIDVMDDLAELRLPKLSGADLIEASPEEQAEWVEELRARLEFAPPNAPAVCVLDTGINRGHPLLSDSLNQADSHAVVTSWGTSDHHGHGTEMAGLAVYGDLTPVLASSAPVQLRHRVESVKILPPGGLQNEPDLYGAVTAEATRLAGRIERRRVFSMAVTSPDQGERGQPTSWSSSVDALAAGRDWEPTTKELKWVDGVARSKLFVVSAGNVPDEKLERSHLERSDIEIVQDPAQAWNALTVGACTELAVVQDPSLSGWSPVALPGDLSPYSTTSVGFESSWPIKPEVVFEGGNVLASGSGEILRGVDELSLLTTHARPAERAFAMSWATSAATAQVSRMAAMIWAEYPQLRPETVRGLIVHSARWTTRMTTSLRSKGKRDRVPLLRRYGYGQPDLMRATRSATNSATLIIEGVIRPFRDGKMRELQVHELPWPESVLQSLGSSTARMRVTLSYFVEPNPSRTGWRTRHRYASHGLRFVVKRPTETLDELRKRLNLAALDGDERRPKSDSDGDGWFLGAELQRKGSVHSDVWTGSAAELGSRSAIAIVPASGWWKDQPNRDRSEHGVAYSLIVGIELEGVDVDVWTPISNEVEVESAAIAVEAQ